MKIYLAGMITGNENYKKEFKRYEEYLVNKGCIVLNPSILPGGMSNNEYMKICLSMIDCADCVAMMPNWESSNGAVLEHSYCKYTKKSIHYLEELENPIQVVPKYSQEFIKFWEEL